MPAGEIIPKARRVLHVFAVLVAVMIMVIVAIGTWRSYVTALTDATGATEAAAQSAETLTARLLIAIDALMVATASDLQDIDLDARAAPQVASGILEKANDRSLSVRSLTLATAQGEPVGSAGIRASPDLRRSLRALAVRLTGPGAPPVVIGTPERARLTGRWRMHIGRLVPTRSGPALLAAEIQIEEFGDGFALLGGTAGSGIALLRDDGMLLASDPHREDLIARMIFERPDLAGLRDAGRGGVIDRASGLDGEGPQILAWRRVAGRPLLVLAWVDRQRALAVWRGDLGIAIAVVIASVGLIAAFAVGLSRALARQARFAAELKASEATMAEKTTLIEATFAQMSEGLSVYDSESRLVAWNQRYVTLLDLPDDFCRPGQPFTELLAFQAQRGEFGPFDAMDEVIRRAERLKSTPFLIEERETQSGRILQINRRPLPHGGFMSLYTDISERRRFELELARAKDEADRAARTKTEFIQRLSHALRTPLTSVMGYAEVLQRQMATTPHDPLSPAAIIVVGSRQIARLLQDMMEYSEYELGERRLEPDAVDLGRRLLDLAMRSRGDAALFSLTLADPQLSGDLVGRADAHAAALLLDSALALVLRHSRPGATVSLSATRTAAGIDLRIDAIGPPPARRIGPAGAPDLAQDLIDSLMERQGGTAMIQILPGIGAEVRLTFAPDAVG